MSTYTEVKLTLEEYAEYCKEQRDSIDPQTASDYEEYAFRDYKYLKTLKAIEEKSQTSM